MRSIAHTAPSGTYNRLTGTQAAPITHGPCHRNTITLGGGRRGRREKSMSTVAAQGPRAAARRVALGHAAYVRSKADLGSRMGRRGGGAEHSRSSNRKRERGRKHRRGQQRFSPRGWAPRPKKDSQQAWRLTAPRRCRHSRAGAQGAVSNCSLNAAASAPRCRLGGSTATLRGPRCCHRPGAQT